MDEDEISHSSSHNGKSKLRRRKLIILCVMAAALLVILLAVSFILILALRKTPCQPIDVRPVIDLEKIKPIPSQDYRALVRFAGYLVSKEQHFDSPSDVKYLEVKLQMVQVDQHDGTIFVRLETDCATINLRLLEVFFKRKKYQFFGLAIEPLQSSQFGNCSTGQSGFEFETTRYYSCHREQSFPCVSKQGPERMIIVSKEGNALEMDELRISLLELELDGDPRSIKEHKFEKDPFTC